MNSKDRAYRYSPKMIEFLETLPKDTITQTMSKQLLRSSTSIGANIVEAQAASSRKDFANFFSYALKSANETVYWLCLLRDAKKINDDKVQFLLNEQALGHIP